MLLLKRMDLAIITLPLATRLAETVFHRHLSARARGKRESEAGVRYVRSRWRQQSKCSPFVTWSLMAATCTTLHSPSVLSFYFSPLFFWVPSLLIRHVDRVAALSSVQAASVILIECKECRQFSFPFGECVCVCVCVRCVCASDRISLHCFTGPILFSAFLAPRFPSSSRCLPPSSPLPHPDLWGPLAYFVTLIFLLPCLVYALKECFVFLLVCVFGHVRCRSFLYRPVFHWCFYGFLDRVPAPPSPPSAPWPLPSPAC